MARYLQAYTTLNVKQRVCGCLTASVVYLFFCNGANEHVAFRLVWYNAVTL